MDLLKKTLEHMNEAEKFYKMSGIQKREFVIDQVQKWFVKNYEDSFWEQWEDLIPVIIDFIILISKSALIIDINNKVKKKLRLCCLPRKVK